MSTVIFIVELLVWIVSICLFSLFLEKLICKMQGTELQAITTKKIAYIGVFSAISGVLMTLEIPLPFVPPFYKLDLSEVPILILTFAYGPIAGTIGELLKVVIKLVLKGTSTAFVGDLAAFIIGCSLILPAGFIYLTGKTKKRAVLGCIAGTLTMTVVGSIMNAFYLLPKFSEIYGIPLDSIVQMGTEVNASITSVSTLVLLAVVPFNLLKGALDSIITILVYKRISPLIKK